MRMPTTSKASNQVCRADPGTPAAVEVPMTHTSSPDARATVQRPPLRFARPRLYWRAFIFFVIAISLLVNVQVGLGSTHHSFSPMDSPTASDDGDATFPRLEPSSSDPTVRDIIMNGGMAKSVSINCTLVLEAVQSWLQNAQERERAVEQWYRPDHDANTTTLHVLFIGDSLAYRQYRGMLWNLHECLYMEEKRQSQFREGTSAGANQSTDGIHPYDAMCAITTNSTMTRIPPGALGVLFIPASSFIFPQLFAKVRGETSPPFASSSLLLQRHLRLQLRFLRIRYAVEVTQFLQEVVLASVATFQHKDSDDDDDDDKDGDTYNEAREKRKSERGRIQGDTSTTQLKTVLSVVPIDAAELLAAPACSTTVATATFSDDGIVNGAEEDSAGHQDRTSSSSPHAQYFMREAAIPTQCSPVAGDAEQPSPSSLSSSTPSCLFSANRHHYHSAIFVCVGAWDALRPAVDTDGFDYTSADWFTRQQTRRLAMVAVKEEGLTNSLPSSFPSRAMSSTARTNNINAEIPTTSPLPGHPPLTSWYETLDTFRAHLQRNYAGLAQALHTEAQELAVTSPSARVFTFVMAIPPIINCSANKFKPRKYPNEKQRLNDVYAKLRSKAKCEALPQKVMLTLRGVLMNFTLAMASEGGKQAQRATMDSVKGGGNRKLEGTQVSYIDFENYSARWKDQPCVNSDGIHFDATYDKGDTEQCCFCAINADVWRMFTYGASVPNVKRTLASQKSTHCNCTRKA